MYIHDMRSKWKVIPPANHNVYPPYSAASQVHVPIEPGELLLVIDCEEVKHGIVISR